jgi:hypothetical protein
MSSLLMGGSEIDSLTSEKMPSNRTGAGNAIILSGRGAGGSVCDGMPNERTVFLMRYNDRRRKEAPLLRIYYEK